MTTPLKIEEARQLVEERGTRIAQELFRKTFDPALMEAIAEKFDERANTFNRQQREAKRAMLSVPAPGARPQPK